MRWRTPSTAPKDGSLILADFGYPWAMLAVWNEHDQKWVMPNLQASPMEHGTYDTYFENEQEEHSAMKCWMPLPKLPNQQKRKT